MKKHRAFLKWAGDPSEKMLKWNPYACRYQKSVKTFFLINFFNFFGKGGL